MTAIYHLQVKIIGRGSGRSAVGAAAYRSGEKLQAVAHSAYQSGNKLYAEGDSITHDYTRKGGVVYSEIVLPQKEILLAAERNLRPNAEIQNQPYNAPPEFADRETLWNTAEAKEKRCDARLAREVEVALQVEFTLQEQKEILREYIQENFVSKGMIADFSIHDKKRGKSVNSEEHHAANPHAHIMLTTRDVSSDGFGGKNRAWDKRENVLIWREKWAEINNRKFEQKGLSERIDHRTLEAQGIDREPTIHMGHEATALERQGIRTERGDINRDIKRRNEERERWKNEHTQGLMEIASKDFSSNEDLSAERTDISTITITMPICEVTKLSADLREQREVKKVIHRADLQEQQRDLRSDGQRARGLEAELRVERAVQFVERMGERREIAGRMNELREDYIAGDKELNGLIRENNEDRQEVPRLSFYAETLDEHAKNIVTLQNKVAQLQAERQNLSFWSGQLKKEKDSEIERTEEKSKAAQHYFKNTYHISPDEVPAEIRRVQEKVQIKEKDIAAKTARISTLSERQAEILFEYHTQNLLAEIRPDKEQIIQLLERLKKPSETVSERIEYEQAYRRLNTLTSETFQKVIENLPYTQAQTLTEQRNRVQAQERDRLHEQTQTHELTHTH